MKSDSAIHSLSCIDCHMTVLAVESVLGLSNTNVLTTMPSHGTPDIAKVAV